jgi:hypothetical protein
VYFTAELDVDSLMARKAFYHELDKQGFQVDVRHFKGKQVYCPQVFCPRSKDGFNVML